MGSKFKKFRNLTVLSFLISAFIHLILAVRVFLLRPPEITQPIEITIVDKNKPTIETAVEKEKPKQIVEQSEKRINDEADKDAKFLSRFDQKVNKETRADKTGKFENAAKEGMAQKVNQTKESPKQDQVAHTEMVKKPVKAVRAAQIHGDVPLPKLADLKPQFDWSKSQVGVKDPGPESATDDHLKDLEKGAQTLLSTREFIYYTYYARIKERLRLFWEPKIREKVKRIIMSGERLPASDEKITKLVIILDASGKLVKIQVLGASGVKDLDDAAIEAFQAAAPFPNPPKGIVESDGTIKIRWDFILEA